MTIFDDLTLIQNKDLVVVDDRLKTMSDSDSSVLDLTDSLLNLCIGCVIDGSRGFVHQQHLGCLE